MKDLVIVMGVAGSGKTTIASRLASVSGWPCVEADDHHPPANRARMASGVPLQDSDRAGWVASLSQHIAGRPEQRVVLACSALTPFVQESLSRDSGRACHFVWLDVPEPDLRQRIAARTGHFMPVSLLQSQLQALHVPAGALQVDATRPVEDVVESISKALPPPDPA
jgi:gluconokinase